VINETDPRIVCINERCQVTWSLNTEWRIIREHIREYRPRASRQLEEAGMLEKMWQR